MEGLSLLFVQKPDDKWSHSHAIATENVTERVYEDVNVSRFPLKKENITAIANKMEALADGFSEAEFKKFFESDDFL